MEYEYTNRFCKYYNLWVKHCDQITPFGVMHMGYQDICRHSDAGLEYLFIWILLFSYCFHAMGWYLEENSWLN